jgi:hypothetical protein
LQRFDNGYRRGWRLPTIQELGSLLDPSVTTAPMLPSDNPFTVSGRYWSASTDLGNSTGTAAVTMDFNSGNAESWYKDQSVAGAWCVRGGLGVNSQ